MFRDGFCGRTCGRGAVETDMRRNLAIPNPASTDGQVTPIILTTGKEAVTDRAYRYRAQEVLDQLPQRHRNRCHFCGATSFGTRLLTGHVDGHEENTSPENISPTCRSCNNTMAANFVRAGIGRRTRQFNPRTRPITTAVSYRRVVRQLKEEENPDLVLAAIARLHATPHARRNRFAAELQAR